MSTTSLTLFFGGVAILLVGMLLPGWDTATRPKRTVKRRLVAPGERITSAAASHQAVGVDPPCAVAS